MSFSLCHGRFQGQRLKSKPSKSMRPTKVQDREAVYNMLLHNNYFEDWSNLTVLDLFAGTGALGMEALSLGVKIVDFVEVDRKAMAVIKENLGCLKTEKNQRYNCFITKNYLKTCSTQYDLIFCDPPFAKNHLKNVGQFLEARHLNAQGLVVVETQNIDKHKEELNLSFLELVKEAPKGGSLFLFYRKI